MNGRKITGALPAMIVVAAAMGCALTTVAAGAGRRGVVHVTPPATDYETDRASILAALEAAHPGDTIQFAPGTYLIGAMIRVEAPRVTLLGHPSGTTLRGCQATDREERHAAFTCQGLELTGGHQTVRGLTFEEAHFALLIGCCALGPLTGEESPATQPGGYLIEDNTFRRSRTGVRVQGGSSEPTVIRGNTFRNLGHAVTINGGTNHVLDNDVAAPDPEQVPVLGNPVGAIGILPVPPTRECGANVIAGNRIEGHPDAIDIIVAVPGTICRGNVIRNNTIRVRRVRYREPRFTMGSPADSTIVGIPIAVTHIAGRLDLPPFPGFEGEAFVGDNVIERNRIEGGFGLGIEIRGSDGNRIANNTIRGIERREPFPGNTANSADPLPWRHANGSGIWVSAGSSRNTIADNEFADIAAAAVLLDGDSTVVQLRSSGDKVRDRGSANQVSRLAGDRRQGAAREPPDPTPTTDPDSTIVFGVADEYFAEYATRAANLDYPGALYDRLPDNSLAGLRRWQEREDEWLTRLDAVDADALEDSAAWALYVSLRERLEASVQFRVCRRPLWNVDPDWGWHIDYKLPDLARSQPVGTPAGRAAALRRWSGFGRFVDTEIDNLRQGMREGYVAPRAFVEEVIEQVGRLAGQAPESSTFYDPARRDTTPEFREAFGRILSDEILPALRRYQLFLTQEYLPRARSDVALTSMPDGLECYRAFLRRTTGLPLDETQVDSIGRALLPRALAERDGVARTRYGLSDGRALSEAIAGDSALMWASHAKALAAARSAVARAADLLPRYFSRLPPIPPLVVDTMTTVDALNASYGAYYAGIPADTEQPARVVVNPVIFDDPGNRGRLGPLAYHEGLPGHHLQAAFDRAFGPSHPYARYADDDGIAGIAGFMEGWATYAQHFLALEMGLLSDAEMLVRNDYEISQLGWFLITDGIHMRGWSEDQVRDTVRQYLAGLDDDVLHDAYIVAAATPGYTLNYLLGALEIQRLRTLAERELGASFDLREFHDQVLRYGDIPLGALRAVVQRWIREKRDVSREHRHR